MEYLDKKVDELFDNDLRNNLISNIDSDDVNNIKKAIKDLVMDFNKQSVDVLKEMILDGQAPPHITNSAKELI